MKIVIFYLVRPMRMKTVGSTVSAVHVNLEGSLGYWWINEVLSRDQSMLSFPFPTRELPADLHTAPTLLRTAWRPCMAAMHGPLHLTHVAKQSMDGPACFIRGALNMCCGQSCIKGQAAMLWTLQSKRKGSFKFYGRCKQGLLTSPGWSEPWSGGVHSGVGAWLTRLSEASLCNGHI